MTIEAINALALRIAERAHAGQFRKDGATPYIEHPMAVAAGVPDELKAAALLHDSVEDSAGAVTLETLRTEGIPEHAIQAVDALTKREGEPYAEYIERLTGNLDAVAIKIADLRHNLSGDPSPEKRAKYEAILPRLLALVKTARGENAEA